MWQTRGSSPALSNRTEFRPAPLKALRIPRSDRAPKPVGYGSTEAATSLTRNDLRNLGAAPSRVCTEYRNEAGRDLPTTAMHCGCRKSGAPAGTMQGSWATRSLDYEIEPSSTKEHGVFLDAPKSSD